MEIYIGLLVARKPDMFDYPLDDSHAVGDLHFGVTAGTAWVDHKSLDETKQLEPGTARTLNNDVQICAFRTRQDRLMWLRAQSGNRFLTDPGIDQAAREQIETAFSAGMTITRT